LRVPNSEVSRRNNGSIGYPEAGTEVLGSSADRELIRSLASRLASDSKDAARIRAAVRDAISPEPGQKGGILKALRRSPLVGSNLDIPRPLTEGRKVEL
jgi:hypothetical protein